MKKILLLTIGIALNNLNAFCQEGGGAATISLDTTSSVKEKAVTISIESAFANSYLWRGIQLNRGLVVQPSVNLEWKNFTFNIWNNTSMFENNDNERFQEVDITISKTFEPGNFYLEPTLLVYTYPSADGFSFTSEASIYAAYYFSNLGIFINPSTDFIQNTGGTFSETGLNYDRETDASELIWNIAYGIGNEKFISYNILSDVNHTEAPYQLIDLNISYQKNFGKTFYIKPYAQFTQVLNTNFQNALTPRQLNFSFSIGAKF